MTLRFRLRGLGLTLLLLGWPAQVTAQNGTLAPVVLPVFVDSTGAVCASCTLTTYETGTSTPLATYQDLALATAHANPLTLAANGTPPAPIYLSANTYRFLLQTSGGTTVFDRNGIVATHAGVTGVSSTGDLTFQVDTDNDTANVWNFNDGTSVTRMTLNETGDLQIDDDLTIGDATEADKDLIFDGNAQDYYVCSDDSADELVIGRGNACGTTPALRLATSGTITFPSAVTFSDTGTFSAASGVTLSHASGVLTFSGATTPEILFSGANGNINSNTDLIIELDKDNNGTEVFEIRDGASTPMLTFTEGGILFLNDNANTGCTICLTINQGGADNEILALKSSDVTHGTTAVTETDTYGLFMKRTATGGGLQIRGLGSIQHGIGLYGTAGTANTTKSVNGLAPIYIEGGLQAAGAHGGVGADGNLVVVASAAAGVRFILDEEGDSHQDVGTAWTNFDAYADAAVLDALSVHVSPSGDPIKAKFAASMEALMTRDQLAATGLVTFNADGHHFVNMSRLTMLNVGAIRQQADQMRVLESRFETLEQDNRSLRVALAQAQADLQRVQQLEHDLRAIQALFQRSQTPPASLVAQGP